MFGLSDYRMELFFEQRKQIVPKFILNALKGYENNITITFLQVVQLLAVRSVRCPFLCLELGESLCI